MLLAYVAVLILFAVLPPLTEYIGLRRYSDTTLRYKMSDEGIIMPSAARHLLVRWKTIRSYAMVAPALPPSAHLFHQVHLDCLPFQLQRYTLYLPIEDVPAISAILERHVPNKEGKAS